MKKNISKTSYQVYLEEGRTYAARPNDICIDCKKLIGKRDYVTVLKIDSTWDRKEKFDFYKHCTDELRGYRHFSCSKKRKSDLNLSKEEYDLMLKEEEKSNETL